MDDQRYREYLKPDAEFWMLPYIGRPVNEKYEELFNKGVYYPCDDRDNYPEYSEDEIIIRIEVSLYDDRVEWISYSKFVDHGIYYKGSDDKLLNSHDIKVFREVLDACTESEASELLEQLKQLPLKKGWRIKRSSEKSITLENDEGTISLPVDYAKQVIEIACNTPDIRNNEDFWEINKKHLRAKYKDAIFALLYSFDHEHFPSIHFPETAKERIEREDREEKARKRLVSIIKKDQTETAIELIDALPDIPRVALEAAAKKKNAEIIERCVFKTKNSYDLQVIGEYAIKEGMQDLLAKVADQDKGESNSLIYDAYNSQRIDFVLLLQKYGYTLHIRHDNKTKYKPEELLPLVDCKEVYFATNVIDQLYSAYGTKPIKQIIENYHYCKAKYDKSESDGYYDDERTALVEWLIEKEDLELIDAAVNKGIKTPLTSYSKEEQLAIRIFNEDKELWTHAEGLFAGHISFSKCIKDNNLELLEYLVKCEPVTEEVLRRAIEDHASDEAIGLLVQHWDQTVLEKVPPGKLPIWYYGMRIKDANAFEAFFEKYAGRNPDKAELQEIHEHFVWWYHDPEKALILVNTCHLPDGIIKESELACVIPQSKALTIVENEYYKDKNKKERIKPHQVSFIYHDDHTWEVKGKPSRSQYDTPHVEELYYLVIIDDDKCTVKRIVK